MSLLAELTALKSHYFGAMYSEHPQLVDEFLVLLAHILRNQDERAWRPGQEFQTVLAAHSIRLLTRIGVRLDDRWNLSTAPVAAEGNLLRATRLLLQQRHQPTTVERSLWAEDTWDDCYVALALHTVLPGIGDSASDLVGDIEQRLNETQDWIRSELAEQFAKVPVSKWKGPGFGAAAIELAAARSNAASAEMIVNATQYIRSQLSGSSLPWRGIYSWHVGQVITSWSRHRGRWLVLETLTPEIEPLYQELLNSQLSGAWLSHGGDLHSAETVYCTARALSAAYLVERGHATPAIAAAHQFILQEARWTPPLHNLKACLNIVEAFQDLLQFSVTSGISAVHLHLLVDLTSRLGRNGLEVVLTTGNASDQVFIESVRTAARRELERRGVPSIEPTGINDVLFSTLKEQQHFVEEFGQDLAKTRTDLARFLSAPMDEIRSHTARSLLKDLWSHSGFLSFLPILERVSNLEHGRAFYRRYRDHVNHELMFFLTGCFLYYRSERIRNAVNAEIQKIYDDLGVTGRSAESEFLFRWKLVATFHDTGYMFEVEPDADEASHLDKDTLIQESLESQNSFSADFAAKYLERQFGLERSAAQDLANAIASSLSPMPPRSFASVDDLLMNPTTGSDRFDEIAAWTGERLPGTLFRNYFNMCRLETAAGRNAFYDHGIMSAVIMLTTTEIQHATLLHWQQGAFHGKLKEPRFSQLRKLLTGKTTEQHLERAQFWSRFNHVAGAIALHNIYPRLHTEATCLNHHLGDYFYGSDPDRLFTIRLHETALGFMTAVVDALQDWDRHSFRRPSFDGEHQFPIASGELLLIVRADGRIVFRPLSPAAKKRYERQFAIMSGTISNLEEIVVLDY